MADKSEQLVLDALSQASLHPAGVPLYGSKSKPGLFPISAPGRQAAQRCQDEGYVRILRTEPKGRSTQEICAITEKGLAHLLNNTSPRHVLEDLVRALDARQAQFFELVATARQTQLGMEALRLIAQRVLEQIEGRTASASAGPNPQPEGKNWRTSALEHLARWQSAGASEDCALPALYRHVAHAHAGVSIGQFHDGLRELHEWGKIYLHPWTGPLYDMPEPPYALLIGHEILYYASLRQTQARNGLATVGAGAQAMPFYEFRD